MYVTVIAAEQKIVLKTANMFMPQIYATNLRDLTPFSGSNVFCAWVHWASPLIYMGQGSSDFFLGMLHFNALFEEHEVDTRGEMNESRLKLEGTGPNLPKTCAKKLLPL